MEEEGNILETIDEYKRKIRFLSNDIRQYTEDVQSQTKKQRGQIQKLKKENASLKEDIKKFQPSPQTRPQSNQSTAVEPPESYQDRIDSEAKKIKELEANIKIIKEKIFKQRQDMGGINASRDTANALEKQKRILENRLDKANQKFNEAIASNKKLREEIDNLRRERVIFDNIYQKLEKELQDKRKEMANIIEEANRAYEDRDRAQDQLSSLKQTAEKEQVDFEKEWKELNTLIEKDKKMKDFLKLRQNERDEGELSEMQKSENESFKRGPSPQVPEGRIKNYEEAFNKIQSATGVQDIDLLVNSFIKAEEKNFKLFKFVNEVSNDIESLEKQIQGLQIEISNYNEKEQATGLRKKKLQLEEKRNKLSKKCEMYEVKYQETSKIISILKEEVMKIFQTIECQSQLAYEFIGDTVTESNLEQYLTLIEQRASEIFQAYALNQMQRGKKELPKPQAPTSSSPTRIEAPNVQEDLSDEDDQEVEDDKPLTAEEFKQRAHKKAMQLRNLAKSKKRTKTKVK